MQTRTIIAATIVALLSFACANETASNFFRSAPTFYPTAQQNYEMGVKEQPKDIASHAEMTLPTLRDHLMMVEDIAGKVGADLSGT